MQVTCNARETIYRVTFTFYTNDKSGNVLKANFGFSNSLEGLTEPTESYYTLSCAFSQQNIPIKISQEKKCIGQSPGSVQEHSLQLTSSSGLMDHATLLAKMCDNMHGRLPTRETHLSLGIEFFLELYHADMVNSLCG